MPKGHLSGKTALVTGGGSGIGRETARALAAAGCRVAIAGRTEARLRETCDLAGRDAGLLFQACDVADPAQVRTLVEWATRQLGRIDILVGRPPVLIRNGGSIPLVSTFMEQLKVDCLLLGFGLPDDNTHSPNEKFSLRDFHRGIKTSAHLWWELQTAVARL